ncbi:MAG TPA: hypothetical protein VKY85_28475 [Candidatus Angelobacter sp.]|nr:hypothetical protein [Candidatus Angelobacter sp.]
MNSRTFLSFLLVLFAANFASPQANSKQVVKPNVYDLKSDHLHVTYSTTGRNGQPNFSYQDGGQTLSFKGNEIRQEKSEIGTLVTVTIRRTVDAGSTTFTLLVPAVRLAESAPVQIHTIGITTAHKFSVVPAMNLGQTELYTTTELSGTAAMVLF